MGGELMLRDHLVQGHLVGCLGEDLSPDPTLVNLTAMTTAHFVVGALCYKTWGGQYENSTL